MRVAYLGPEGSFTHQAALVLAPDCARLDAKPDIKAVLHALHIGSVDYAVAAIDSAAGRIEATTAALSSGRAVSLGEHHLRVSFDLYRAPGDAAPLRRVLGHEKALAQIAGWLAASGARGEVVTSNTAGLARLAEQRELGVGAVGPAGLEARYRLVCAARALEGATETVTRFVLLASADAPVRSA